MSRVGKMPVALPDGVTVEIKQDQISVKGKSRTLSLARDSVRDLPLTLIWSCLISTVTPSGRATGIFPTRDITDSFPLGDVAQHFAAHARGARLAIGHHALGGGDDGNAHAVHDLGDVVAAATTSPRS